MRSKLKRNYVFEMAIGEQDLAEGKNPPICDGCNDVFVKDENNVFHVTALVLNSAIYGLECEACVSNFFKKMPRFAEKEAPDSAKRALHGVLGREMVMLSW